MPRTRSAQKKKPAVRKKSPRARTGAAKKKPARRRRAPAQRVNRVRSRQKKHSPLHLRKISENPIILPRPGHDWESWQVFNPGVVDVDGRIHFIYRAIGQDAMSRLGYAASPDGFFISERLPYPVYEHYSRSGGSLYYSASGGSWGGSEDPRLTLIAEDDTVYMTYTACDGGLGVALTSISKKDFLSKRWNWKRPKLISSPREVHKNWVLFPEKIGGRYALLHSINPTVAVEFLDNLEFADGHMESIFTRVPRKNCWDTYVRGVGAPPLKTKDGWLLFYHANSAPDTWRYKVGALLLDLADPTKVLARSPEPVLVPDAWYEHEGFKSGIVYVSGVAVRDGKLLVYYGGADSYVCVAYAPLETFLAELKAGGRPRLRSTRIRK